MADALRWRWVGSEGFMIRCGRWRRRSGQPLRAGANPVTRPSTESVLRERDDALRRAASLSRIVELINSELDLQPRFGQDGAYTADLLPTEAGDYTWHIFGDIAGTPVDVSMTSGPDTFSPVEARSALSFPDQEAESSAAARSASLALILAGVAALLGLAGLVLGYLGYRAARSA